MTASSSFWVGKAPCFCRRSFMRATTRRCSLSTSLRFYENSWEKEPRKSERDHPQRPRSLEAHRRGSFAKPHPPVEGKIPTSSGTSEKFAKVEWKAEKRRPKIDRGWNRRWQRRRKCRSSAAPKAYQNHQSACACWREYPQNDLQGLREEVGRDCVQCPRRDGRWCLRPGAAAAQAQK